MSPCIPRCLKDYTERRFLQRHYPCLINLHSKSYQEDKPYCKYFFNIYTVTSTLNLLSTELFCTFYPMFFWPLKTKTDSQSKLQYLSWWGELVSAIFTSPFQNQTLTYYRLQIHGWVILAWYCWFLGPWGSWEARVNVQIPSHRWSHWICCRLSGFDWNYTWSPALSS